MSGWLPSSTPQITNVNKNVKKRKQFYTVGWNVNWRSIMENSNEISLKSKNKMTISSSNSWVYISDKRTNW